MRELDLSDREFRTKFGGLFLFVPYLATIPFEELLAEADFPGSEMIPAAHAMRSLLALKLFGSARHSHVMSYVFDEGLALFAGLNVIPKRSFLTEYSCRIDPRALPQDHGGLVRRRQRLGLERGISFDLDFHTIPFHGEDALVAEALRLQAQPPAEGRPGLPGPGRGHAGVLLRQRRRPQEDRRTTRSCASSSSGRSGPGICPEELVFDSKLTTYANLNQLNKLGIDFITLRRRSAEDARGDRAPAPAPPGGGSSSSNVARAYRTPGSSTIRIQLGDYEGTFRQLVVRDLGHEEPTLLLTNQMRRSPAKLDRPLRPAHAHRERDRRRHRLLPHGRPVLRRGHEGQLRPPAHPHGQQPLPAARRPDRQRVYDGQVRHIFRDLVDAVAQVTLTEQEVVVRFQKRAHNPLLLAAGFSERTPSVPWWGGRRLRLRFG